jgi:hypothetical protein
MPPKSNGMPSIYSLIVSMVTASLAATSHTGHDQHGEIDRLRHRALRVLRPAV